MCADRLAVDPAVVADAERRPRDAEVAAHEVRAMYVPVAVIDRMVESERLMRGSDLRRRRMLEVDEEAGRLDRGSIA